MNNMKLYATTTSERASKGQGGNEYLDIFIYTTSKEKPSHRLQVWSDDGLGKINVSFKKQIGDIFKELVSDKIYTKGEKQKKTRCPEEGCIYTIPCILGHKKGEKLKTAKCLHESTFNYMGKIHCTKCKEYLN